MNVVLEKKDVGRGFKSLREVYEEISLRVRFYMIVSFNRWIKEVWKDDRTPEISWIESVSKQLRDNITSVKEFNIAVEIPEKEKTSKKGIEESI